MCSCFHSHSHVLNITQQEIRKVDQLLMAEMVQQWEMVIKHNFFPSLTSNVLNEEDRNIRPWMGEWQPINSPNFLNQRLAFLKKIPFH